MITLDGKFSCLNYLLGVRLLKKSALYQFLSVTWFQETNMLLTEIYSHILTWNCRLIDYLCGFLCVPPVKEDPRHQNVTSGTWFSFIVKDSGKLWFVIWFCLVCFGWVFFVVALFCLFWGCLFFRFFFLLF